MDALKMLRHMAVSEYTGAIPAEPEKYYDDVPLPQYAPVPKPEPVPQQLRKMRSLTGYLVPPGRIVPERTTESLFYEQGRFMERYSDDYSEPVECRRAVPTYAAMSYPELRAYFTWRTKWRSGEAPEVQYPFLLLYTSELVNLIGEPDAPAAYAQLIRLYTEYGKRIPAFGKHCRVWLLDFAAYYDLPDAYVTAEEQVFAAISEYRTHPPAKLLSALDSTSAYCLTQSKSCLADPQKTAEMLFAAFSALDVRYHAAYGAFLLGEIRRTEHIMFEGCVLYPRFSPRQGAYRITPLCTYYRYAGRWAVEALCRDSRAVTLRKRTTGEFLRTFDCIMREETGFKGKLKPAELPAGDAECIRDAVRAYLHEQARKNIPAIRLDTAELEKIRQAAGRTEAMLTLPEEEPVPAPRAETAPVIPAETSPIPGLSAPAAELLRCLLAGKSPQNPVKQGQMLSVLAEEINEAFYDDFGDTVLDTAGDMPVLIEDYAAELREKLK